MRLKFGFSLVKRKTCFGLEIRKRERFAVVKSCLSSDMNNDPAVVAVMPYL